MNKAVIFDLDGTLCDTIRDIVYYVNLALKKFGYNERSREEVISFIGHGSKNLIKKSVGKKIPNEEIEKILDYYLEKYNQNPCYKTCLFDGVMEVINNLKSSNYKLAVLTNKPQSTAEVVINKFFDNSTFDIVLGQRAEFKLKPDANSTNYILSKLNVKPENAFIVGDGETDYQTSINANTKSVSVLWGYRSKEFLASFGAKNFAKHPIELLNLIK